MEEITLVQHNVLKWTKLRANELWNIYREFTPHIILNSTGLKYSERIKLYGYNTFQKNKSDEEHSGIAIAIRKDLQCQLLDNTTEDVLGIKVETSHGQIIIVTTYVPPRRHDFPYQDLLSFIRKNVPVYIIGDLNARHLSLGYNNNNANGNIINNLINQNLVSHLGPEYKTWITPMGTGTPDIVLGNQKIYHNIAIKQGPITTSDHIPMIIKISTKPILNKRQNL